MTPEQASFGEKTVNKLIELVLSRLVDAESIQVRVRGGLQRLGRGEVDGLMIQLTNFLFRPALRVGEFQLDIGAAAVDVKQAMRRKIQLLHPSSGDLRLAISQAQLAASLVTELSVSEGQAGAQLQQVECQLESGSVEASEPATIAVYFTWITATNPETGGFTAIPEIAPGGTSIELTRLQLSENKPPEVWVKTAIDHLNNILSLHDINNRGTTFTINESTIGTGIITIKATAHIEQFPSR